MSVVNVEMRCRMPSFSASPVVRSARICFRRREARLNRCVGGGGDQPAAHLPSTARPGPGGADPYSLAVEDEPRVDPAVPPVREHRLDGFRHPLRVEPHPESCRPRRGSGSSFVSRTRRERADFLILEGQCDRLVHERLRFGHRRFGRRVVSVGSTWVNAGESVPTLVCAASRVAETSGRRRRPRRRAVTGRIENEPCARRPGRGEALEAQREAAWRACPHLGPRDEHWLDVEHGRARVRQLPDPPQEASRGPPPRVPAPSPCRRLLSASPGWTSYVLSSTTTCDRPPARSDLGRAWTPGSGFSQ